MRYCHSISLAVVLIAITGCNSGGSADGGGQSEMDRMAQMLEQENATQQQAAANPETASAPIAETQTSADAAPAEEPVKVGASDPNREESFSLLQAAGNAYVYSSSRTTVWQHQSAIKNFQAEHGYYPKSHEEYMKKIVDGGLMILPEPDEGYEFWYNPEDPLNLYLRPIGSGENAEESP